MNNGNTAVRIMKKSGRELIGVEHIGVAHNEEELAMFFILAREKLKDERQGELKLFKEAKHTEIRQVRAYSKYLFEVLEEVYNKLKFKEIEDDTFKRLTLSQIIEPTSKADSIRVLSGLGIQAPTDKEIRCSLKRTIKKDYRKLIADKCCEYIGKNEGTLLLYDVTTLHFEISKEDDYRKSGFSKERRLEPQIIIGLLVDKKGFPLSINSFEGNKAETKTITPVLKRFKEENKIKEITIVADAGMLSANNLELLEAEGYKFIVGSRISKVPYEIEEYRRKANEILEDSQIFEGLQKINKNAKERRVVYQYRQKRAEKDLRTINDQIKKARLEIQYNKFSRKRKFVKVTNIRKEIDEKMIEEARLKAGIKGYVTNLTCDGQIVIDAYHNLFEVEKSFRMTKSDLQARPIFQQTRDSIEAHLTVCFAALAISRYIQDKTKISIKKFVRRLKELRTGIVQIGDKQYTAEPVIDSDTEKFIKLL
jgi:transposase